MRRFLVFGGGLLVAAALIGSCGDDTEPANPAPTMTGGGAGGAPTTSGGGSPTTTGGGAGASGSGTGGSADAGRLVPCLDRPDDLPRPPMNELPCELLPPGFSR